MCLIQRISSNIKKYGISLIEEDKTKGHRCQIRTSEESTTTKGAKKADQSKEEDSQAKDVTEKLVNFKCMQINRINITGGQ